MHVFILTMCLASWVTSLIYCIGNAEWLAVIVLHVFLVPLGIIHGFFVWFNASWF